MLIGKETCVFLAENFSPSANLCSGFTLEKISVYLNMEQKSVCLEKNLGRKFLPLGREAEVNSINVIFGVKL